MVGHIGLWWMCSLASVLLIQQVGQVIWFSSVQLQFCQLYSVLRTGLCPGGVPDAGLGIDVNENREELYG